MSIKLEEVSFTYQPNSPYEYDALREVNLEVHEGEFIGLIGHTGSGKSTLIQHFNGLLKPTTGRVIVDEVDITAKGVKLKQIRQKVGMVFQYPEHQLFEETVFEDIAFGPKNIGLPAEKIIKTVKKAMDMVDLDYNRYKDLSPFTLSGGEKRRVAIAGVLAMEPKYLILDEPTAGLDPRGRDEILSEIEQLHHKEGIAVVLVSHSMDDVARLADRLLVINNGSLVYNDVPRNVFKEYQTLQDIGLDIPTVSKLMLSLKEKGWPVRTDLLTIEEAKEEIIKIVRRSEKNA